MKILLITLTLYLLGASTNGNLPPVNPNLCAKDLATLGAGDQGAGGIQLKTSVEDNKFEVRRGLRDYFTILGQRFIDTLKTFTPTKHWVNVGAGLAVAERDYFKNPYFSEKARVTSIAVNHPEDKDFENDKKLFAEKYDYRYLMGYIEQLDVKEIGESDLTTDVFGAMTYANSIYDVLAKYAQITNLGGIIQFSLQTRMHNLSFADGKIYEIQIQNIKITDSESNNVSLLEWIKSFKGFEILDSQVINPNNNPGLGEMVSVSLKKTSTNWQIPKLEVSKIEQVSIKVSERLPGDKNDTISYISNPEPQRSYILKL